MKFGFLSEYGSYFINGTKITIVLSSVTLVLGFMLGILICLLKISKNKVLKFVASAYIEFLRGTPLMIQLFIVHFGFPQLGIKFPSIAGIPVEFISGVVAISLNSSAYIAEILRSGIQSVDKGQMEASYSLGFNYFMSMRYVVIPQALKNSLPSLVNEFITLIKESAIVSVIGIQDLMYSSDIVRGATWLAFEPLIVTAIIYFILTFSLSKLVGLLENRLKNKSFNNSKKSNSSIEVMDVA